MKKNALITNRRVGDVIEHPDGSTRFIFAGYDPEDGEELWCDVCLNDDDSEGLCAPEKKTFLGFNEAGTDSFWESGVEEFCDNVEKEKYDRH